MEFEVKYTFLNHRADFVRRLLESKFKVDPHFPKGVVTSIYFDTKRMSMYEEKRASTFLKKKIRLRWYLDPETGEPDTQAFWEVKSRTGTHRTKSREPSNIAPCVLEKIDIDDPVLLKEAVQQKPGGALVFPSVMIRYTRHRFVDRTNGSRVNVDTDIYARKISRNLANEKSLSCLPVGVLEYKGVYDEISPVLSALGHVGIKKRAFSKYESAIKWVKTNQQLI